MNEQTPQTVLVLGGATGLLGQALVKALQEKKNYKVHTLGRADGNILDKIFLEQQIEKINPHLVFNTIGYTAVDKAEEEKDIAYAINRDFVKLLAKILIHSNTKLIHYSTDFVFDGKKRAPYTEQDPVNPLSVYGASKYAGEQALTELKYENMLIIRTSWLFGAGRKNFISTILQKAKETGELTIVHDQIGSPTYTKGLAYNTLALINKEATGLFHLSNVGRASWYEFAQEAIEIANIEAKIKPVTSSELNQAAQRPPYSVLSTEKFIDFTGKTPRSWTHALREYIFECFDFNE